MTMTRRTQREFEQFIRPYWWERYRALGYLIVCAGFLVACEVGRRMW